jgi:predicted secreted protein
MKKLYVLIICLCCLCASSIYAANVTANKSNEDANVITATNPTYTLKLASNPTTGYSWLITYYDQKVLVLKKHQYVATNKMKNGKAFIGAGGYEVWQFEATAEALKTPQTTSVKLAYVRSWEIKSDKLPANTQEKVVTVVIQ